VPSTPACELKKTGAFVIADITMRQEIVTGREILQVDVCDLGIYKNTLQRNIRT